MLKLTKRIIDPATVKPKEYFIFDSELPCFGVRIMPSGYKSYLVQYRDHFTERHWQQLEDVLSKPLDSKTS